MPHIFGYSDPDGQASFSASVEYPYFYVGLLVISCITILFLFASLFYRDSEHILLLKERFKILKSRNFLGLGLVVAAAFAIIATIQIINNENKQNFPVETYNNDYLINPNASQLNTLYNDVPTTNYMPVNMEEFSSKINKSGELYSKQRIENIDKSIAAQKELQMKLDLIDAQSKIDRLEFEAEMARDRIYNLEKDKFREDIHRE